MTDELGPVEIVVSNAGEVAPIEEHDQGEAYPFMKPVLGEGVVFDASPERRREMLHNQEGI